MKNAETEFRNKIDCRLPYNDAATVERLIDEALSISHDAMFTVLHEICRAPQGRTTPAIQLNLADLWLSKATHPISHEICDVAKTMINRENISVDQAIIMLDKVTEFPTLWSALHIIYFSCDDTEEKMESHYNKVTKRMHGELT